MSNVVDERTLVMNFDNENFERNVSTTMSSLDKLKSKLSMKGAASGLDDVSKSVKGINFGGITSGIGQASSSLMSFGNLAKTVLGIDIIRYLENVATKFATAITTQPLKDGLAEYENQINSVQTIMANTGDSVKTVNATLDELNEYADKTIYNFGQMTSNLGTFTAALGSGSLEKSALAIKGIGNWAAYAGAGSQDMARATFQLSQALAQGNIRLQDWMSIEHTAGMAGKNFQNEFIATARTMGTGVDEAISKYNSFRESLKAGWLTTDVFMETMRRFANDQSMTDAATKVKTFSQLIDTAKEALGTGWAQVFRTVIGDFEEAKAFWTKVSDMLSGENGVITRFFNIVNSITDKVFTSKWDQLDKTLKSMGFSMTDFTKALTKVFQDYGGDGAINNFIKGYKSLDEAIKAGAIDSFYLKEAFMYLTGGIDKGAKSIAKSEKNLKKFSQMADKVINGDFGNGAKRVKELTKAGWDYNTVQSIVNKKIYGQKITLDDLTGSQDKTIKLTEEQRKAYEQLVKEINDPSSDISWLLESMGRPSGRELLIDTFLNAWKGIAALGDTVKNAFTAVFDTSGAAQTLYNGLYRIAEITSNLTHTIQKDAPQLQSILSGIFSVVKFGLDVVKMVKAVVEPFLTSLGGSLKTAVLNHGAAIGDAVTEWVKWFETSGKMYEIAVDVYHALDNLVEGVKNLITHVQELESVQELCTKLSEIWETIIGQFQKFEEAITKSSWYNTLTTQLKNIIQNLPTSFTQAIDTIAKFLNNLFNGTITLDGIDFKGFFKGFTAGMFDTFKGFYEDGISGLMKRVSKFGSDIIGAVGEGLGTSVKGASGLKVLSEGVKNITDTFSNALNKVDLNKFAGWAVSGGFVGVLYKMSTAITHFSIAAENFSKVALGAANVLNAIATVPTAVANLINKAAESVAYTITQFGKTLRGVRWKMYGEAIVLFAKAIGILVTALAGLTALTYYGGNSFWGAIIALEIIVADIVVLMMVLDKLAKETAKMPKESVGLVSLAGSLVLMSGALVLVASAVAKLGKLGFGDYVQGLLGVAGIIAAFVGIVTLLGKLPAVQLAKIAALGKMALELSGALAIFAIVIGLCGNIGETQAQKAIAVAGGLLIFLKLLSVVTKNYKLVGSDLGDLMLKLSVSIGLLVAVTKRAGDMSDKDMAQMVKFASGFIVFIGLLGLVTRKATAAAGLGAVMAGVGVAMYLMSMSVQTLSQMTVGQLAKGLVCVTMFGLVLMGIIRATDMFRGGSFGLAATLVAAGIAILTMSTIAVILGMVPIENLAKGVVAVSLLGLVTAALIKNLGSSTPAALAKATTAMFAIGICVGMLGALTWILANTANPRGVAAAGIALACLMAGMSIMMYATKFSTIGAKALGGIAVALVCAVALGALLYFISDGIDPAGAVGAAAGISAILLAMSGALAIAATFGNGIGPMALAGLGVLAVVCAVIGFILYKMDGMDPVGSISNAVAIGALILALSVAMVPLAAAGAGGPAALIGAGILLAFVLVCGALAMALGYLATEYPQIQQWIDVGGPLLVKMAETAGEVIGAFAGGIVGSFAATALVKVGQGLSDFMAAIQPFINSCRTIRKEDFANVGALTVAIMEICAAQFISAITSFMGINGLDKFATNVRQVGTALLAFNNTIASEKFNPEAVEKASKAAKYLGEFINNMPKTGGIAEIFTGDVSWKEIKKGVEGFGEVISKFGEHFQDDGDKKLKAIELATKAGTKITDMTKTMPKSDGLLQVFTGEIDWKAIKDGVEGYGEAIKAFGKSFLKNGDDQLVAIQKAAEAGRAVADMVKILPKDNGIWQFFVGTTDWDDIEAGVKGYGDAIGSFGTSFKNANLSLDTMSAATKSGELIAGMIQKLPTSSMLEDFFCGNVSWDDITNGVKKFGEAIGSFGDKTKDVDVSLIENGVKAGEQIAIFGNRADLLTEKGWIVNSKIDFNAMKNNLMTLASAINQFSLMTNVVDPQLVNAIISSLKTIFVFGKDEELFKSNVLTNTNTDFTIVKKNIADIASAISQFGILSKTVSFESLSIAEVGVEALGNVGRNASIAYTYLDKDYTTFVTASRQLAVAVKDFYSTANGVETAPIKAACEGLMNIVNVARNIGETTSQPIADFINGLEEIAYNGIDNYIKAFQVNLPEAEKSAVELIQATINGYQSKEQAVNDEITKILTSVIDLMTEYAPKAQPPGVETGVSYINGVLSNQNGAANAGGSLAIAAVEAMNGYYNSAYNAGIYIGQGLANGLYAMQNTVYNAAQRLANLANQAIRIAQGIHSPSTVQYDNGEYMGLGLIRGLESTYNKLRDAGQGAASAANMGISEAIRGVQKIFDTDVDAQPVIRPVLDLTNIEDGVSNINRLSTLTPTMGLSANIRSLSSINQNGIYSNSDVVAAVNGLSKRIDNIQPSNTYNVNGVTYDDGSNVSNAVGDMIRAIRMERRI